MNNKLPKIFVNKNVTSNNKKVSYNEYDMESTINEAIKNNIYTLINYNDKSIDCLIIGRTKNKIVTKDGLIININEIKNVTLKR